MIAILSDFGDSEYLGVMKAVMLKKNPHAMIHDLCNSIEAQNIRQAAWVLFSSYKHFPQGTAFLCVVDPGVGYKRNALAVKTSNYTFVGPDNGLLYPAAYEDGIEQVISLRVPRNASRTFHGRDVFAPAAADLDYGLALASLGLRINIMKKLVFFQDRREGEIVRVDHFGNIITNLPHTGSSRYAVSIGKWKKSLPYRKAYQEAQENELFLIEGSFRTLEIALKNGSASSRLKAREGQTIRIT